MQATATLLTATTPGAVAIIQIAGDDTSELLRRLTGKENWQGGKLKLCDFAGIDHGLAGLLPGDRPIGQLMPHGGPRVVQRLLTYITEKLGATYEPNPDARTVYPEAGSPLEADALAAIARCTSPVAIDLLVAQAEQWRALIKDASAISKSKLAERSRVLDQLLAPPTVVVVGPANVGKSTLTNHLMGRSVSIVADLPGTTRDWVGGMVELGPGVAVRWLDTPGLRESGDTIEQRAIALARRIIGQADVIIAMRDPEQSWPLVEALPRTPDLWVVNKVDDATEQCEDRAGFERDRPLQISAEHGRGVVRLEALVLDRLGLLDLTNEPWAFSPTLKAWCAGDEELADYVAGD